MATSTRWLLEDLEGFLSAPRRQYLHPPAAKDLRQRAAEIPLVVDEHHADVAARSAHGVRSRSAGSITVNRAPPSARFSARMVPFHFVTILVADRKPEARALADGLRGEERLEDPRLRTSSGMPVPSSSTSMRRPSPSRRPATRTAPPSGIACRALLTRLVTTCCICGIDPHRGQVRCEVEDQLGIVLRGLGPHEADDLRELLGGVDASDRAAALAPNCSIFRVIVLQRSTWRFVLSDGLPHLGRPRVRGEFPEEIGDVRLLRRDDRERVVDLVGEAGGHLADGGELARVEEAQESSSVRRTPFSIRRMRNRVAKWLVRTIASAPPANTRSPRCIAVLKGARTSDSSCCATSTQSSPFTRRIVRMYCRPSVSTVVADSRGPESPPRSRRAARLRSWAASGSGPGG